MPKVSVIVPCFNSEPFIKETLESVLSQSFTDLEVIAVDDGSTDGTKGVLSAFKDSRIRYFYQRNSGLSEARNNAIRSSSGRFIALIDHDDLWLPQKLEKQLEMFDNNEKIGLVFSDSYILNNGKKEKETYFQRCRPEKGNVFEALLFGSSNFIPVSTVLIKREIIDRAGPFKKEFRLGEELELFLRIARYCEFDYVDEPQAFYRIHASNFSRNKEIFVKEAFDILRLWQEKEPALFASNRSRYLKKESDILSELANFYALNFRKKDALLNFDLSLKRCRNRNVLIKKYVLLFSGCLGYKILGKFSYAR